jgi:hypothetical protein
MPQPETRGERRSGQKGPFMDGNYVDFLTFFLSLAAFSLACFTGMQPHPQTFFFSAILITSFLLKRLSNNLNNCAKKIAYT